MIDGRTPLIGLDWGSTQLRAYRFDIDGAVAETRQLPLGLRQLAGRSFADACAEAVAGWPSAPVLAAGMVGSRQGWCEVPYCETPADAVALAGALRSLASSGHPDVHLVPGLRDPSGPDVMRGEETQIVGALLGRPELAARSVLVLPGTHSKWVRVREGRIEGFRTLMTGELYGLLREHSLLAAGVPSAAPADAAAFERGVDAARDSGAAGALSRLFSARALMLDGTLSPAAVPDYLSGLLIGEEYRIAQAAGWLDATAPLQLLGDAVLCARYAEAARRFACRCAPPMDDPAPRGLWRLAQLAGLTETVTTQGTTA